MARYCPEFKRTLVSEALTSGDVDATAERNGVGRSSLFRWIKAHGADVFGVRVKQRGRPRDWSFASKLKAIIETQGMNEREVGEYLRSKGIYYSHIVQWKNEVLEEVKKEGRKTPDAEAVLLKRIRELEHELKLKDNALKEATALLILKKKAESAWPARLDDKSDETTDKQPSTSSTKPDDPEPD
jgi:hypothetical protein